MGTIVATRGNLGAEGFQLLLVARRADRLEKVAADVKAKHGVAVTTLVADLASSEDLARLSSCIGEEDVTMLVNNAGAGGISDRRRTY